MSFDTRVITVFGGSGFIGRHLIRRLARSGAIVRIATRRPSRAAFLKTAGAVGQIVPLAVDVRSDESVARAVKGSDLVINLIGTLHGTGGWSFGAVHAQAAGRIARLAKAAGARRMVHVSALGADARSASAYARSKAEGEQAVRDVFPEAAILRPSVVFGPEDDFFNRFAAMAQVSPVLPLIGGGQTKFQPVYVGDVAAAIVAAATLPGAAGQTYELGGPKVYTFKALMDLTQREIRRNRKLVTVPWNLAETLGGLLEKIPLITPPLTRDQVTLLRTDNVLSGAQPGLAALGVTEPTAVEVVLPTYLHRFIVGGTYAQARST